MNDLRIMAGEFKGMGLKVPSSARPMTTRVKAVIFDTLMQHIPNSKVLDLFAGSGNLGLEALSRGASQATLVDHDLESIKAIESNILKTKTEDRANAVKQDYKIFLKRSEEKFDLIFIDPPFDFINDFSLNLVPNVMKPDTIVIVKFDSKSKIKLPEGFTLLFEKTLGENKIFFLSYNV